jgi:hypothetical protein
VWLDAVATMPESCSCGAILVENARFCHRCGRDLRPAEPSVEVAQEPVLATPAVAEAAPAAARAPLPVSFANPVALRIGFLMSLALMVLEMIPGLNVLFLIWWLGAGFCGVLLYRRLTGLVLSVRAGARLGSITGVLTFVSMAVIFALTMVFMGKDLFQQMVKQDPRMSEVIDNPPAMAGLFLMVLAIIFAMVVGTCAAGGALGARFAGRDNSRAPLA